MPVHSRARAKPQHTYLGTCRTKVIEETDATFGALLAGASSCMPARSRQRAGECMRAAGRTCATAGRARVQARTGSGGGRDRMAGPAVAGQPDAAPCPPRSATSPPLATAPSSPNPKNPAAGTARGSSAMASSTRQPPCRPRPAKSEASGGLTIVLPSAASRPLFPPLPRDPLVMHRVDHPWMFNPVKI